MFTRAADYSPAIVALSPDFMDWPYLAGIFGKLPEKFAGPVAKTYREKRKNAGQQAANIWAGQIGESVTDRRVSLAASDSEICEAAKKYAEEIRAMLADAALTTPEAMAGKLADFAKRRGIEPPKAETLAGIIGRLTDETFWRRQLRRAIGREIEQHAITLGLVHRFAGCYVSDETTKRHAEQQRRNAAGLEATQAENELGQVMTLAELAERGVSNPNIRRAELMTRIKGFEDWAKEAGDVGRFYTWTAPSRMHARLSKSGQENPKYDGTTPKEAAGFLARQWAKARAWLNRRGLYPYGFRVAEPHHDGTPHWHLLLFMPAAVAETVTRCLQRYAMEPDAEELNSAAAIAARFKAVDIDWSRGSAAGYIAKYVCKNIDGKKTTGESLGEDFDMGADAVEGAARVRAWASCWGIRQFQQIGGPGVTIWRELRRIRAEENKPVQGELFELWGHADKGVWSGYIRAMGGIAIKKADRPAQVWAEATPGKLNRYGEEAGKEICGVELRGVGYETRIHQWTIRRAAKASAGGFYPARQAKPAAPWTRVNNCTRDAWQGIAANMAGWEKAGFRGAVIEIFNEVRRIKGGIASHGCSGSVEQGAVPYQNDGRGLRRADSGGTGRHRG